MIVVRPCSFCGVPMSCILPDNYEGPSVLAHTECLPTPDADGAQRILDERRRQVEVEGYQRDADQQQVHGELGHAALAYLFQALFGDDGEVWWPADWSPATFKPSALPMRNLEKAGALIAAEIDRQLEGLLRVGEGPDDE